MRTTIRPLPLFVLACVATLAFCTSANAAQIEAIRGKHYLLTKRHGPWMIMVASFNKPPELEKTDGMTPAEAAEELVFELRRRGIPAYTFEQKEVEGDVKTIDRRTQEDICICDSREQLQNPRPRARSRFAMKSRLAPKRRKSIVI